MNYISQLQRDLRQANCEKQAALDGLNDLITYVNSRKFFCGNSLDGYVSVGDITLRANEIKARVALNGLE